MMLKRFFKRNKESEIERLFFSLERLTNIAVVKTSTRQDALVKEIISGIEKLFLAWLDMKVSDPERYKTLTQQSDFFESKIKLEIPKKQLNSDRSENTELSVDEDKKEKFILLQERSRELNLTGKFLSAFGIIWEEAIKQSNEEISAYVIYHLEYILADQVSSKENQDQIEQILQFFNQLTWELVTKYGGKRVDKSAYPASVGWYVNIVFNAIGDKKFDIELLSTFNNYFYRCARIVIKNSAEDLFKYLVSSLVDRGAISSYDIDKLWDYELFLSKDMEQYRKLDQSLHVSEKIQSFITSGQKIRNTEQLYKWKEDFANFIQMVRTSFSEIQIRESEIKEKEIIEEIEDKYKSNSLLDVVFAIGGYCVFMERYGYVRYLVNYKQPADSDASWSGEDIVPSVIQDVINLYPRVWRLEREYDFWEDHHGNSFYFKAFFIILLMRAIERSGQTLEQLESVTFNFELDSYELDSISRISDELGAILATMSDPDWLPKLESLGFRRSEIDSQLLPKVKKVFLKAAENAKSSLETIKSSQNISQAKLDKFANDFLSTFDKAVIIRDIFKLKGKFLDKSQESYSGDLPRFGINTVDDKAAFFDEWYVHYGEWGSNYGSNMAAGENNFLIEKIIAKCEPVKAESIKSLLEKFDDLENVVLISNVGGIYSNLFDDPYFIPEWKDTDEPKIKISRFKGYYKTDKTNIPVFESIYDSNKPRIIALDMSSIGELVQYSPLNTGEDIQKQKSIFYLEVQVFSEAGGSLMDKFLENPPDWLKKIGDPEKQKKYLNKRVLLNIFQRYEMLESPNFQGYIIDLPSK